MLNVSKNMYITSQINKFVKTLKMSENYDTYKKLFYSLMWICSICVISLVCYITYFIGQYIIQLFGVVIEQLGNIVKNNPHWWFSQDDPMELGCFTCFLMFWIVMGEIIHMLFYTLLVGFRDIETSEDMTKNKKVYIFVSRNSYKFIEKGQNMHCYEYIYYSDLYRIITSYIINTFVIFATTYYARWILMCIAYAIGSCAIDIGILVVMLLYKSSYTFITKSQ